MKKTGTWYLIGLAALLGWIGGVLSWLNRLMVLHFESTGCITLPPLSELVCRIPTWPFFLAAVALVYAVLGVWAKVENAKLVHVAFWLSVAATLGLLAAAVGYTVPCVPIITPLR